uniref:Ovomucoid n=1 Tax=Chrysemys picta bellii TaxID=8478 RepID=A0A8C3IHD7_CHRPI
WGAGEWEVALGHLRLIRVLPVCVHYILKPMCILYYRPVCGSDGTTYRNKCELCSYCREHDKNIKIVKEGAC